MTTTVFRDEPMTEAEFVAIEGSSYLEHSTTEVGDVLHLTEPVVASIDPAELLPPR